MSYVDAIDELGRVAQALLLEKNAEEKRMQALLREQSIKQRMQLGSCIYPLEVVQAGFAFGGKAMLELERLPGNYPSHELHHGSPVHLFPANDDGAERLKGMVIGVKKERFKLILHADELPDNFRHTRWAVELRFDDKSFFEMEKAMNRVINLDPGPQRLLRDKLLGYAPCEEASNEAAIGPIDPALNPSQQRAVKAMCSSTDLTIVHGPPGTGKTSTLAEGIRLLVQQQAKVLVCAPSNTAVDQLTMKLNSLGVPCGRIGHAARMDAGVHHRSIDHLLLEMPEMKLVADLRKRALDAQQQAAKHKRSFGPEERRQREDARKEMRSLRDEARELERFAEEKLLSELAVVTCTLVGASDKRLNALNFDLVVIDEAAQALEPACWIPILRAERVVLAGDPFQLPPTVKDPGAERAGLSVTLMEKALERSQAGVLLNEQYRMNERIMGFSNEWFYEGKLLAHPQVAQHALAPEEAVLEFIDTAGCGYEEEHPAEGSKHSLTNPDEAALAERILRTLLEAYGKEIHSVGVISPYKAQTELLQSQLESFQEVSVHTVDGFQGQERDVILISLTRSNPEGVIGFLADYRRMNVAMTRARRKLVVIGDSATLGGDAFFAAFMEYCERHDAYRSAWGL